MSFRWPFRRGDQHSVSAKPGRREYFRPRVEVLEDRPAPAAISWTAGAARAGQVLVTGGLSGGDALVVRPVVASTENSGSCVRRTT
jgi:hypothetical protein